MLPCFCLCVQCPSLSFPCKRTVAWYSAVVHLTDKLKLEFTVPTSPFNLKVSSRHIAHCESKRAPVQREGTSLECTENAGGRSGSVCGTSASAPGSKVALGEMRQAVTGVNTDRHTHTTIYTHIAPRTVRRLKKKRHDTLLTLPRHVTYDTTLYVCFVCTMSCSLPKVDCRTISSRPLPMPIRDRQKRSFSFVQSIILISSS